MSVAVDPVALDAGAAWFEASGAEAAGTVCAVFRRAAYLRLGERILALCGPTVEPGPLHLRLDRLPELAVGQAVVWGGGRLELGPDRVSIDSERMPPWVPPQIEPEVLRRAAARRSGRRRSPDGVAASDLPGALLEAAAGLLRAGDLMALARLVGGRGPGLTPAGDDLLAGALVADAALHPAGGAARHRAAGAARTNDVAAAFLRWAAAGQCIGPVHDVLAAMAAGDPAREGEARAALSRIGASSGVALLLGLELGLAPRAAA